MVDQLSTSKVQERDEELGSNGNDVTSGYQRLQSFSFGQNLSPITRVEWDGEDIDPLGPAISGESSSSPISTPTQSQSKTSLPKSRPTALKDFSFPSSSSIPTQQEDPGYTLHFPPEMESIGPGATLNNHHSIAPFPGPTSSLHTPSGKRDRQRINESNNSSTYPMLPISSNMVSSSQPDSSHPSTTPRSPPLGPQQTKWSPKKGMKPSGTPDSHTIQGGSGGSPHFPPHSSGGTSVHTNRSKRSRVVESYQNFMPNMGGVVRSLARDALGDISLQDVLDGRTCSPISFKDFEGFVSHKEYTSENLLFIVWYRSYCSRFTDLPEEEKLKVAVPSTKLKDSENPFGYLMMDKKKKKENKGLLLDGIQEGMRRASIWGRKGSHSFGTGAGAGAGGGAVTTTAGRKGSESVEGKAAMMEKVQEVQELEIGGPHLSPLQNKESDTFQSPKPILKVNVRASSIQGGINDDTPSQRPHSYVTTASPQMSHNGDVDLFSSSPKVRNHHQFKVCEWTKEGQLVCTCTDETHVHDHPEKGRGYTIGHGLDFAEEGFHHFAQYVRRGSLATSKAGSEESLRSKYLSKGRRGSAVPSEVSAKSSPGEDGMIGASKEYRGRRRGSLPMLQAALGAKEKIGPSSLGVPHALTPAMLLVERERAKERERSRSRDRERERDSRPTTPESTIALPALPAFPKSTMTSRMAMMERIPSIATPVDDDALDPMEIISTRNPPSQPLFPTTSIPQSPIPSRPPVTFNVPIAPARESEDGYVPAVAPEHQPMRQEAQRAFATFLRNGGLRELNVDEETRRNAREALKGSTHPDVFLPIFKEIYGAVETQSLPHFLSYAQSNINLPKQLFWYMVGCIDLLISLLMFLLMVFLIPSSPIKLRAWRLFSVLFASFGAMQTYSAWRGFCTQVWGRASRQMHPWEMDGDEDVEAGVGEVGGKSGRVAVVGNGNATIGTTQRAPIGDIRAESYQSSTKFGTDSFGTTVVEASPVISFHTHATTNNNIGEESAWIPDASWDTAIALDDPDSPVGIINIRNTTKDNDEPVLPGTGKPLDPIEAKRQEKHVFKNLVAHLRRDPASVKHRKPAVFGPEIVIMDERVLRLHKRIIRDILFVGLAWGLVWFALCMGVPGYKK